LVARYQVGAAANDGVLLAALCDRVEDFGQRSFACGVRQNARRAADLEAGIAGQRNVLEDGQAGRSGSSLRQHVREREAHAAYLEVFENNPSKPESDEPFL